MRSRWFHRPLFHLPSHSHEKKVAWLELFYDLIFVAALIQLGNGLSKHISVIGFVAFSALFVTLWIAWTGLTYYSNRYTVDDFLHRALVFVQMFAIGSMAITAPEAMDGQPYRFALSYAIAQFVIGVLYLRSWLQQPFGRVYGSYWGGIFTSAGLVWFFSLFVPVPYVYGVWAVGMSIVLFSPFNRFARQISERFPTDLEHLTERYGLLTIIVLGESFVKVLSSLSGGGTGVGTLFQAMFTLIITCSIWWIYFDDVAGSTIKHEKMGPMLWLYGHLPLQLAITATGVGIKKAVGFDFAAVAPAKYCWLLAGSLGLVFLSVAIIDSVTERRQAELSDRSRVNVRALSGLAMILLAAVSHTLTAGWFLGMVLFLCLVQVAFDLLMAPFEHTHDEDEAPTTSELYKQTVAEGKAASSVRPTIDDAIRKGVPSTYRKDLYFYLMEGSWLRVFVSVVVLYVVLNVIFAGLFLLQPGSIQDARLDSFADAFFFSVQTMSTIGYGGMTPATTYGHILVTIEAAVAIIGVALITGLMFAKASRAKASVLFSRPLLYVMRNRKPAMMFRVGNARGNDVVDAEVSFSVLLDEVTAEGSHLRRIHDLKLMRRQSPFFALSWTVIHEIDKESPLYGLSFDEISNTAISFVVTLTGHDGTYGQTIYARHIYSPESLEADVQFMDVIRQLPDGRLLIDFEHFHEVSPAGA